MQQGQCFKEAQSPILTKFREKVMDYINIIVQQKLKISENLILLNYISSIWNLRIGQCK